MVDKRLGEDGQKVKKSRQFRVVVSMVSAQLSTSGGCLG